MKDYTQAHTELAHWFTTPAGVAVGDALAQQMMPYRSILHGECLLQIGSFTHNPWLEHLRYHHQWLLSPHSHMNQQSLSASLLQLPFEQESLNAVVAPLALHMLPHSQWPLDELDRIIKPMGYLVIFAINPLSLWGAGLRLGILPGFMGQGLSSMSAFNLQRVMEHKGYTQYHLDYFYYMPPIRSNRLLQNLSFLNHVGSLFPLYPAAFYLLIMQKYRPAHPDVAVEPLNEPALVSSNF
ncbi:MAG: class I SAM-dependent methyltransferase [Legionellaceae bacterium]|nr:class I SAM-dependent methyltransferase [Legionellaceae bacterium]